MQRERCWGVRLSAMVSYQRKPNSSEQQIKAPKASPTTPKKAILCGWYMRMPTKSIEMTMRYATGELFCGAGGLTRGFHSCGFRPRFANDVWDVALHTFMMNFDQTYAQSNGAKTGEIVAFGRSIESLTVAEILAQTSTTASPKARRSARRIGARDLDVLLGGPPCQGYSLNSHIRCADDPRNHLFRHYVRILHGLSPKVFVLENVPGMLSLESGRFFDELISTITAPSSKNCPGYEVAFKILNAAHYGVPQERFRVVVVGTRRDVADVAGAVALPEPVHYSLAQAHFKGGRDHTFHYAIGHGKRSDLDLFSTHVKSLARPVGVSEAIGDLPHLTNGGGVDGGCDYTGRSMSHRLPPYQKVMRKGAKSLKNHWCRVLFPGNVERAKHIPAGGDWRSIPRDLLPPGMQRALRKDHTTRYGRLSPDQPAGTILTKPDPHWGTFLHYDVEQQRLLSVREAARLQSFPDVHVFHGNQVEQYKLCGNAVPPLMAAAIARQVEGVLDSYYCKVGNPHATNYEFPELALA